MMDTELSPVQNQIQSVNSNPTVVLNGSIFNLCTLSNDGVKTDLENDKFDTVTTTNLGGENCVFTTEGSKGKIFPSVTDNFQDVQVTEFGLGAMSHGVDIATSTVPAQLLQHDPITTLDGSSSSFIQIITSEELAHGHATATIISRAAAAAAGQDENATHHQQQQPTSSTPTTVLPATPIASAPTTVVQAVPVSAGAMAMGGVATTSGNTVFKVIPIGSTEPVTVIAQIDLKQNTPAASTDTPKKRGGWPKGKRRKIPKQTAARAGIPKPPQTGYVIYATEHRSRVREQHPGETFSVLTKILGAEWSALDPQEKQKYLDLAEDDKQRYKDELHAYEQSDEYLSYVAKKKAKTGNSLNGEDGCGIEDTDNDMLYCKVCDQYFSSLHNRKEHMFGKTHLNNISNAIEKISKEDTVVTSAGEGEGDDMPLIVSFDNDGHSLETEPAPSQPLDLETFILQLMEKNNEREVELRHLRKELQTQQSRHITLVNTIKEYEELHHKYVQDVGNAKAYGSALATQINTLRMVPTLFGVINFMQ